MNDVARDALALAGLTGHPQAMGALHADEGDCAIGVIHIAAHRGNRFAALRCGLSYRCAGTFAEMDDRQLKEVWLANDRKGWDFLTISRKCCLGQESQEA